MDKKTSLVDAFIADLAVRYWWIIVIAIVASAGGLVLSWLLHKKEFQELRNRLSVIEERLGHPSTSKGLEPYMVVYGIAESTGQNRQALGTVDATENTFEVHIGPTTAEKTTCYIELPLGRTTRKIQDLMMLGDWTIDWARLPGTRIWYYSGPPFDSETNLAIRVTTELVQ